MLDILLIVGIGIGACGAVALIGIATKDERAARERRYERALIDIATDPLCASRDEMVGRAVDALRRDPPLRADTERSREPVLAARR